MCRVYFYQFYLQLRFYCWQLIVIHAGLNDFNAGWYTAHLSAVTSRITNPGVT